MLIKNKNELIQTSVKIKGTNDTLLYLDRRSLQDDKPSWRQLNSERKMDASDLLSAVGSFISAPVQVKWLNLKHLCLQIIVP